MRGRIWIPVVVVVGIVLGVAIAGVPSRHVDPPLRAASGPPTTADASPNPTNVAGVRVGVVVVAPPGSTVGPVIVSRLTSLGYLVPDVVDNHVNVPSVSVVEYRPGFDVSARAVAATASIGPVGPLGDLPIPSRYMGDASVMVVIGADLKA